MSSFRLLRAAVGGLLLGAVVLGCSDSDPDAAADLATSGDGAEVTSSVEVQAATTERETTASSIIPTTASPATAAAPIAVAPTTTDGAETTSSSTSAAETTVAPSTTSNKADEADEAEPTTTLAPTTTTAALSTATSATPTTAAAPASTPSTTASPTTAAPTTSASPTTAAPTTAAPSTTATPTTAAPTTAAPTTAAPTTSTSVATVRTPSSVVAGSATPPASAISLAAELTQAEQAIRNPAVDDATAASWGRRQQRLYRELSRNSEWAPTVIDLVAADVRNAVELNWGARSNLNSLGKKYPIQDTLPAWRIKEPAPASELVPYYREGESNTGVSWTILAAINLVETRMGRIEGVSTAGAMGPMQFLPTTWDECCEGDPWDPHDAIIGAAHYLTVRGAPGNLDRAIFGYNNSNNYVRAVKNYAAVMAEDPLAYRGYHAWEVYYRSSAGLVRIPIGYEQLEKVDAAAWLEANPTSRISD